MEVKKKKLEKSQIELEFELTADEFNKHFEHALEHLKSDIKIEGFRAGKAPNKIIENKIKPETLLMEAGDIAVKKAYSEYIKNNNLEIIGYPQVQIIKIAKGSPFIFKVTATVLPEVELPDYKEIAKSVKDKEVFVSDEEIQDALNYLQKSRAKMTLKNPLEPMGEAQKSDFVEIEYSCQQIENGKVIKDQFILGEGKMIAGFEDNLVGMKAGEEKTFKLIFPENSLQKNLAGKEGDFKVKMISVQKMELPEINDEFARQLGKFDNLITLKTSIKEGLTAEKQEAEKQRKRTEILEKIAEKAKFEIPELIIEQEKQNLLENLKKNIRNLLKVSFEEYLSSIKKTEEEVKETYQKEAEKRLRNFLVLRELGKRENIDVSEQEVEEEISKSIKNFSKEQLAKIDINELMEYTKGMLYNEKVFQKLEMYSAEK